MNKAAYLCSTEGDLTLRLNKTLNKSDCKIADSAEAQGQLKDTTVEQHIYRQ